MRIDISERTQMVRLNESTTGEEVPAEQGNSEVGYCKPPEEHRFKKGVSGNPDGPPVRKTNLWVWFTKYMALNDAEIDKLDMEKLTQAQHAAMKLRDIARNGKSGFIRLALAILDREEGKAVQTQLVADTGKMSLAEALTLLHRQQEAASEQAESDSAESATA